MRIVVIGLALFATSIAEGADRPVPQDTARMEARAKEALEWNRKTLAGAYDKVGKKYPKWDAAARETLDLAARRFSQQRDPIVRSEQVFAAAKKAVDAGCDDPMVLYLYGRASVGENYPGEEEFARRSDAAAEGLKKSQYPPIRRGVALAVAARLKAWKKDPTPEERAEAERDMDAALELIAASVAEDPRNVHWEASWYDTLNDLIGAYRQLSGDDKAAFDRVDAALAKVKGVEALRLAVKGNFFLHWGWKTRTTAFAPGVSPERARTFESRLKEARSAPEEAWKLNPDQPHVAGDMVDIEKAIGDGDRDAMELWFERAMKADGNDYHACWSKLDWLDPKWHGDPEKAEMMAFAKACLATGNFHSQITLISTDAHYRFCEYFGPVERMKYLRQPEVWAEIARVNKQYLDHYPEDAPQQSKFASLCYMAANYRGAHAQFEMLGDRLTTWSRFPNLPLATLKAIRDDAAIKATGKPRVAPAEAPK